MVGGVQMNLDAAYVVHMYSDIDESRPELSYAARAVQDVGGHYKDTADLVTRMLEPVVVALAEQRAHLELTADFGPNYMPAEDEEDLTYKVGLVVAELTFDPELDDGELPRLIGEALKVKEWMVKLVDEIGVRTPIGKIRVR